MINPENYHDLIDKLNMLSFRKEEMAYETKISFSQLNNILSKRSLNPTIQNVFAIQRFYDSLVSGKIEEIEG